MNKISKEKKTHMMIVGGVALVIAYLLFQFGVMSKIDKNDGNDKNGLR